MPRSIRLLMFLLVAAVCGLLTRARIISNAQLENHSLAPLVMDDEQFETFRPELALQTEHGAGISAIAVSPDGKTLASTNPDRTIQLWDVDMMGAPERTLAGHSRWVYTVAFSPDGKLLASGAEDGVVKLWDVETEELRNILLGHTAEVRSLAFSPDGKLLASGGHDGAVKLWDVRTGQLRRTLSGRGAEVRSVAFSPDGKWLASGVWGHGVELWSVAAGELKRSLHGHQDRIHAVAFSPDGKLLASGGQDGAVTLWEIGTGEPRRTLLRHRADVDTVAFSPDGKALASGSWDKTVRLWDTATGALLDTVPHQSDRVRSVAFSARFLASAGDDGKIGLYTLLEDFRCVPRGFLRASSNWAGSVAFSPDGKWLASGSPDMTVQLWDVGTGSLKRTLRADAWVYAVAFSADGKAFASSQGGTVKLWDVTTGALLRTLREQNNKVSSIAFSPNGKLLASGNDDDVVRLWEVQTGKLLRVLRCGGSVLSVAFSPDGILLASGSENRLVQLWNVATGALVGTLGQDGEVRAVAFSPDSKTLAIGSGFWAAKLWSVATGELKHTLTGHHGGVNAVAFSPDGKSLACGSMNRAVMLWDVETGSLRYRRRRHSSIVRSVAFSPNGKLLASGSDDNMPKVWDAPNGRLLVTLLVQPEVSQVVTTQAKGLITLGDKDVSAASDEWFVMTPEGWFDCSANAARFVRWRVSNEIFPAERYWRRFRRPDLVQQALRGEKVPDSAFTSKDIPPITHFVRLKYERPAQASSVTVMVETRSRHEVKAQDVVLLVNGRPLPPEQAVPGEVSVPSSVALAAPGAKPIDLGDKAIILGDKALDLGDKPINLGDKPASSSAANTDTRYTRIKRFTFRVLLPLGANEVRLRTIAYDSSGLGSNWTEMIPLSRPKVQRVPGHLYVLCIGISRYKNADGKSLKNLKFAAADARDMAARLQREGKPLYEHVEIYNGGALLNEQATLTNMQNGLRWLQQKTRPGQIDTVMVFLSGHGVSDKEGRYYLPSYEFDVLPLSDTNAVGRALQEKLERTSLSGRQLQEALGGKLRAKSVFLFVDSCHSGALSGARNDDLNFEVNTSGVYMMASSGSAQSSYEYEGWGHGAFTLALLKSLNRPDLVRNGAIRFNVLTYAVPEEISKLMQAAQQNPSAQEPVVPLEGRHLDEPVAQPQE